MSEIHRRGCASDGMPAANFLSGHTSSPSLTIQKDTNHSDLECPLTFAVANSSFFIFIIIFAAENIQTVWNED